VEKSTIDVRLEHVSSQFVVTFSEIISIYVTTYDKFVFRFTKIIVHIFILVLTKFKTTYEGSAYMIGHECESLGSSCTVFYVLFIRVMPCIH
jgi:hypothetical protein